MWNGILFHPRVLFQLIIYVPLMFILLKYKYNLFITIFFIIIILIFIYYYYFFLENNRAGNFQMNFMKVFPMLYVIILSNRIV